MRDPLEVAQATLDAVVAGFADATVTAAVTLPDIQYVTEGRLAPGDGEQLTVAFVQLYRGMPGGRFDGPSQGRADKWSGMFEVELLRKRGAGLKNSAGRQSTLPTKTRSVDSGQTFGGDIAKMVQALQRAVTLNLLASTWQKVALGLVTTVGPDGGLVGIRAAVSILLL